jgi:hypothetical protein
MKIQNYKIKVWMLIFVRAIYELTLKKGRRERGKEGKREWGRGCLVLK